MGSRVFISDTHVSAGSGLKVSGKQHPWDWFTKNSKARLLHLLEWILWRTAHKQAGMWDKVDELVLVGDVFDNWVYPHDVKPPTFHEILTSDYASPVCDALNAIASAAKVTFVPGNHDMTLTANTLKDAGLKIDYCPAPYVRGGVRAEHGNLHALFCAPDPEGRELPLGYFISRIAATAKRDKKTTFLSVVGTVKRLLAIWKKDQPVVTGIFDEICCQAGLDGNDRIKMPDDLMNGAEPQIKSIRRLYKNIYDEFVAHDGPIDARWRLWGDAELLDLAACSQLLTHDEPVVIMGHTHKRKWFAANQMLFPDPHYVNTGAWIGPSNAAWAEVGKVRNGSVDVKAFRYKKNTHGLPMRHQRFPSVLHKLPFEGMI